MTCFLAFFVVSVWLVAKFSVKELTHVTSNMFYHFFVTTLSAGKTHRARYFRWVYILMSMLFKQYIKIMYLGGNTLLTSLNVRYNTVTKNRSDTVWYPGSVSNSIS
jgi:hypothetical protein